MMIDKDNVIVSTAWIQDVIKCYELLSTIKTWKESHNTQETDSRTPFIQRDEMRVMLFPGGQMSRYHRRPWMS